MEEDIKHYKLGNTIQEFEEIFGNVPFEDIEKIKKYLLENYIQKSKIKEKINAYSKSCTVVDAFIVDVLQELMEDK